MTTCERVRKRCREVVDPCSAATGSNLDIVEMGLLKSIDVTDGHVSIEMRITTPACHMVPYFVEEVKTHVSKLPDVESVALEIDSGFEWSEDMMTDEARRHRQAMLDEMTARHGNEISAE